MDKKGEHSTYRVISGIYHRLQYSPEDLETLSTKEMQEEIRALVQIINSGRLHNEKQRELISDLEGRLEVAEKEEPKIKSRRPPPGVRRAHHERYVRERLEATGGKGWKLKEGGSD